MSERQPSRAHKIMLNVTNNGNFVAQRMSQTLKKPANKFYQMSSRRMQTNPSEDQETRRRASRMHIVKKPKNKFQALLKKIHENPITEWCTLTLTIIALYLADIRTVCFDRRADMAVDSILIISMIIFIFELITLCIIARNYAFVSTYFWLDVLAIASMPFDIILLSSGILPAGFSRRFAALKAGRAAKSGARTQRILRLSRISRMSRMSKMVRMGKFFEQSVRVANHHHDRSSGSLMSSSSQSSKEVSKTSLIKVAPMPLNSSQQLESTQSLQLKESLHNTIQHHQQGNQEEEDDPSKFTASSIGNIFMEMTVTKTMMGIVLMLIVLPMLQHSQSDHWVYNGLLQLRRAALSGVDANTMNSLVYQYMKKTTGLYYLKIENIVYVDDSSWRSKHLRKSEKFCIKKSGSTRAKFSVRRDEIGQARSSLMITTFIILVIGIAWIALRKNMIRIGRAVAEPLIQIARGMDEVARLETGSFARYSVNKRHRTQLNELEKKNRVTEIREINASFIRLRGAIESFAKFVPREVVLSTLQSGQEACLGVDSREISIFFSDIAGFTTISEELEPEKLLELLSEYFAAMSTIIQENGGTLLEFIGDAILAVWNAPIACDDHAACALRASLQMQHFLRKKESEWLRRGYPSIHIRCGLHTAVVWVGNLGSPERIKYGVMGDGVNLSSRLEELNKRYDTSILLSEFTAYHDTVRENFFLRPIDFVAVKGRQSGLLLYECKVLNRSEPLHSEDILPEIVSKQKAPSCSHKLPELIKTLPTPQPSEETVIELLCVQHNAAMQCFMMADFRRAILYLDAVALLHKASIFAGKPDTAARLLRERCTFM